MAVAVARHLVKVDPGNPGAWINLACYACVTGHMEAAKVRLPSILIKGIRRLAVDGDHLTDQEASECSNTVKYHDVRRSLHKWRYLCQNPSTALWLGERESRSPSRLALSLSGRLAPVEERRALVMASARDSQIRFQPNLRLLEKA